MIHSSSCFLACFAGQARLSSGVLLKSSSRVLHAPAWERVRGFVDGRGRSAAAARLGPPSQVSHAVLLFFFFITLKPRVE